MPNLYVVSAIVVAMLSLAGYGLYERGNAANARAEQAETRAAELTQSLQESEADKARMRADAKRTDAALVEKDNRLTVLLAKERNLRAEYEKLKGLLDQKDQDCLDRPLPDPLAARLRDPGHILQDGNPEDTRSVPHALPEVVSP